MRNIAVIGCGYWGKNLVRNFYELGALAAVCDPVETVAKTFSEQYHAPARSWEEILSDTSIHGVVLAVPVPLHAKLCIEALEAGKDVFVEKPLALTKNEGLSVKEILQKTSHILLIGHLLQYHPAIEAVKRLLADGTIGSLKYVRSVLGKFDQMKMSCGVSHRMIFPSFIVSCNPILLQYPHMGSIILEIKSPIV